MKHLRIIIFILSCFMVASVSCKKRDKSPLIPESPPESGEVITTVKIIFTDSASGISRAFFFADPDGPGGLPAFYGPQRSLQHDSVIHLTTGSVYQAQLFFLNESVAPADTVSNEIVEEGDEHIVFYDNGAALSFTGLVPATVELAGATQIRYADEDENGQNIGLLTRWKAGSGTHLLRITLKHQHDGKAGDITAGDTEVEVFFRLAIDQ